MQSIFFKLKSY